MQKNLTGLKAIVWSQPGCSTCSQAKVYLELRGYAVEERIVGSGAYTLAQLHEVFPGVRSVPQIEVDGLKVGSYTALKDLFDKI